MTTVFLFAMLFALLVIGVPIAIALGLSATLTILFFGQDSLASLTIKFFQAMQENYTLLAIPFFVLAGNFMTTGGVARRMILFAVACVGHLPGGLAIASVLACMLFAAVSGSSPATVVAIGSIVIAGMVKTGYTRNFAAGTICNAGTLGILIPPSIVMVVYAAATESSVGRLFMAGIIPGLLLGGMLMGAILIAAIYLKLPREPWPGFWPATELVVASARDALWGLLLIMIVLGGIYGGVMTPTEAAAVAAVYAFFAATFIYRDMGPLSGQPLFEPGVRTPARNGYYSVVYGLLLFFVLLVVRYFGAFGFSTYTAAAIGAVGGGVYLVAREGAGAPAAFGKGLPILGLALWQTASRLPVALVHADTRRTLVNSGRVTIMLLFIIADAFLFSHVLTTEQIPQEIARQIAAAGLDWWQFLIVVNVILLIAGNFMEPSSIILILAPILFPIALQLEIDPIHLGVIMVVNMEIGMVTPPVGLNLFVTSGVTGMSVAQVTRAALPWLMILLAFLVIVTYVPIISLWLPNLLFGPS